jgi:hypothetical protein
LRILQEDDVFWLLAKTYVSGENGSPKKGENSMKKDYTKYQNIILTLAGGERIIATVPAFCEVGETLHVANIEVKEPQELEADCRWGDDA